MNNVYNTIWNLLYMFGYYILKLKLDVPGLEANFCSGQTV